MPRARSISASSFAVLGGRQHNNRLWQHGLKQVAQGIYEENLGVDRWGRGWIIKRLVSLSGVTLRAIQTEKQKSNTTNCQKYWFVYRVTNELVAGIGRNSLRQQQADRKSFYEKYSTSFHLSFPSCGRTKAAASRLPVYLCVYNAFGDKQKVCQVVFMRQITKTKSILFR